MQQLESCNMFNIEMEDQNEEAQFNVGRYPYVDDLDKKILTEIPQILHASSMEEIKALIKKFTGSDPTPFQIIKFWSYSKLSNYDGLAFPYVEL